MSYRRKNTYTDESETHKITSTYDVVIIGFGQECTRCATAVKVHTRAHRFVIYEVMLHIISSDSSCGGKGLVCVE